MSINIDIKMIIECLLISSEEPLSVHRILALLKESFSDITLTQDQILHALTCLKNDYRDRSIGIYEVASGFRFQVHEAYTPWLQILLPQKQERYSQAILETLTLIAYRQPITRGEIEQIRGVSVSTPVMKTLLEREWVRVLGYKQVPGKPALYGTTLKFLNDFNLSSLSELPQLANENAADPLILEQGELCLD